jgi:hypothetical protein
MGVRGFEPCNAQGGLLDIVEHGRLGQNWS